MSDLFKLRHRKNVLENFRKNISQRRLYKYSMIYYKYVFSKNVITKFHENYKIHVSIKSKILMFHHLKF